MLSATTLITFQRSLTNQIKGDSFGFLISIILHANATKAENKMQKIFSIESDRIKIQRENQSLIFLKSKYFLLVDKIKIIKPISLEIALGPPSFNI
jgi:hypothetical protein